MSKSKKSLLVGLDIGTTKTVALVAEINPQSELELIGIGVHPSRGLKRGLVVHIESTIQSIQRALEEAELMAGCQIHSAFTGIAGNHVSSLNSHGIVAIRESEVSQQDIERVIDAAKAVAIPADQQIIHMIPQEFMIDHQSGIKDPIGMSGVRLEAKVHMVTGAVSATQNVIKCVERCGIDVADMVLEQVASSHAVLNNDEKELGVCLIDIGGGTTDIAIFRQGAIRHTAVIPIAGDQVTNDIAIALRTPTQAAEALKVEYGKTQSRSMSLNDSLDVAGIQDRPEQKIPMRTLSEVIEARYDELFRLIAVEIYRHGLNNSMTAGIVLTGGASLLPGLADYASTVFNMPVRIGYPKGIIASEEIMTNPMFATGIGLLLHAQMQQTQVSTPELGGVRSLWHRIRHWFQGNF